MPIHARDWLASRRVRTMNTAQVGAFFLLLCDAWPMPGSEIIEPCTIPDDDAELAVLSGLGDQWPALGPKVKSCFDKLPSGRLRNAKQWRVYLECVAFRLSKSRAGDEGAKARWEGQSNYSAEFERAWDAYPKRAGGNSKKAAFRAWSATLKRCKDAASMIAAVERYAAYARERGIENTEYVMMAATFFGPAERWKDDYTRPVDESRDYAAARWALYKERGMTSNQSQDWWKEAIEQAVKDGHAPSVEALRSELRAVKPWDIAERAKTTEWAIGEVLRRLPPRKAA